MNIHLYDGNSSPIFITDILHMKGYQIEKFLWKIQYKQIL